MKTRLGIVVGIAGLAAVRALPLFAAETAGGGEPAGTARVARWANGATGAFTLMFDDGWPSALDVAMPELKKRGLGATFYIVPAKGEYTAREAQWIKAFADNPEFVAGHHTMHHSGFTTYEGALAEFRDCTDYLLAKMPGKNPRLISYAQPGVDNWHVNGQWMPSAMEKEICDSQNLVSRPTFAGHGAVYHLPDRASMRTVAERAVASASYEYVVFHGVEDLAAWRTWQDFWAMKQSEFLPFFDDVKSMRDRNDLWVADHIAVHKYATERDAASVTRVATTDGTYAYDVVCTGLDTNLYDQPLTLMVSLPPSWKLVKAVQGAAEATLAATNGCARVPVRPGAGRLFLTPADGAPPADPEPEPEPEPEASSCDIIVAGDLGTVAHDGILDVWTNLTVTVGAGTRYVVSRVTGSATLTKRGPGALVFDGSGSDRSSGETVVAEGTVLFGAHLSFQLGSRVTIGGAGSQAALVLTTASAYATDIFDWRKGGGTFVVKDRGTLDFSANAATAELRPLAQVRVEEGGTFKPGAWRFSNANLLSVRGGEAAQDALPEGVCAAPVCTVAEDGTSVFRVPLARTRADCAYTVQATDDLAKPFRPCGVSVQATADGLLALDIPTGGKSALFARIAAQ